MNLHIPKGLIFHGHPLCKFCYCLIQFSPQSQARSLLMILCRWFLLRISLFQSKQTHPPLIQMLFALLDNYQLDKSRFFSLIILLILPPPPPHSTGTMEPVWKIIGNTLMMKFFPWKSDHKLNDTVVLTWLGNPEIKHWPSLSTCTILYMYALQISFCIAVRECI